ncbi:hypothetical protein TcWFU_008030 [Taenia crassiceps]|uniref:SCP domain-containing protein n=1 Tax=Taenia crassiceps TaxID=6207 RepID=A0ABR4Q2D5_9CEST
MEWVDAALCRMLSCTYAATGGAEPEPEGEALCEAIPHYQQNGQSCTRRVGQSSPNSNEAFSYSRFGSGINISKVVDTLHDAINEWSDEHGQRLYREIVICSGSTENGGECHIFTGEVGHTSTCMKRSTGPSRNSTSPTLKAAANSTVRGPMTNSTAQSRGGELE